MTDTLDKVLPERMEYLRSLFDEMFEMGRMRTDFALEHFVVGAHDMPGRQRAQALSELQSLYFALADVWDQVQLDELDLAEITGDDKRAMIERGKKERAIASGRIHIEQRLKEIDFLVKLLERLPKYSAVELEAEEPYYWARRLERQTYLSSRDPGGNLAALMQYVTIPGLTAPRTPVTLDQYMIGIGLSPQVVATGLLNTGLIDTETATKLIELNTPVPPVLPQPGKSQGRRPRKRHK